MPPPTRKEDITQRSLKEVLIYDPKSGIFKWRVSIGKKIRAGSIAGSKHNCGYVAIGIKGEIYLAHRLAWLYVNGFSPENQIDHINRKRNDNRFSNLREISTSCNITNSKMYITNTSGIKGVFFHRKREKWHAVLILKNKRHDLGFYADIKDAAMARWQAEVKHNLQECYTSSSSYQYLKKHNIIE